MRDPIGAAVDLFRPTAKAPVPFVGRHRGGIFGGLRTLGDRSNPEAQMQAMGSVGTLFAIVNRTSNATSQVEWKLWRKAKTGKVEDRTEVTAHAALDIWRKPNPFMTRQEFVEVIQQHLDLTGEGWWVVARDPRFRKLPLELWPVRPDRMAPDPDPENFLAGYCYHGPDGRTVELGLDEVIQLRMPNPLDPYRGMGPVQSILTDLDSVKYTAEWNRNFFANSAVPGGIVEVEGNLNDDDYDQMVERWREQHQGVANAHRVAILERGKWKDRTFSMRDMQFAELRSVSSEVIREAFGFPKPMLGTVDDVNRSNAEAGEVVFGRWLIVPRLERIKGALNGDFLPLFGPAAEGLEFDYEPPVPPDAEAEDRRTTAKADAAQKYVAAGWPGPVVAEALDLPEALRSGWEKAEPPPPPIVSPGADPAPPKAPPTDGWQRAVQGIAGTTERRPRNEVEEAAQVDLDGLQEDWRASLDALLADWEDVTAAWRDQIADRVRVAANAGDLTALTSTTLPSSAAAEVLTGHMVTMAASGADRVVEEAAAQGQTVEAATPTAASLAGVAVATAGLLAVAYALAGAREALRWFGYGRDGDAVARGVRSMLDGWQPPKGQLGGLLTWAQNAGRLATLQAVGVGTAAKVTYWASEANDKSTCDPCSKIDGKRLPTWDAMMLAYGGGGYLGCEGRERCRGTAIAIWE